MTDAKDYRDTVFLPKTDFPMKAGLPQKEPGILAAWESLGQGGGLYKQLRDARRGREKFILHDGPPYANGDMHIGHALNHILKDMVVRTQSLLGKDAPYVPGWDCHGLPIEWKVEEQYRKKKLDKDQVPVEEFRAECRAYAQHWVDTQREQLKRLGINGDWDNPYLTMDSEAEATIVAELLGFATRGQLYRGAKPVMWSPVEKTALAEAEVEYEDIVSTQIDVAFQIEKSNAPELVGAYAVIWTTTPWTIPVNQAIAYARIEAYSVINLLDKRFVLATKLIPAFVERVRRNLGYDAEMTLSWSGGGDQWFPGSVLEGTMVRHPMHHLGGFFAKPRPMLPGDFVTTDSGTGLVHMAPDHGEDDFDLCKAYGIEPVFAVEGDGKYRADWGWLGGQGSVINAKFNAPDGPICSDLRDAGGLLAASADYKHSYPHSWRSKAKLIYRCTPQWFVPMDKPHTPLADGQSPSPARGEGGNGATESPLPSRERVDSAQAERGVGATLRSTALTAITNTRWVPPKGENRIRSMVEGRPDWVLSRQRAWGVPITLFVDRKTGQYLIDDAVNARIVAAVRESGVDAWNDERAQEYLGADYRAEDYERVTDILDVWFDSGCTHAFVLESGKWPDLQSPADLYLEGSDQHRGWFQSSLLQSCGSRGRAPYKAVLTHGFTMDAKGMKMSKSLGNTIDPLKVMEVNGADIIRMWALSVDFTEDHRIGDEILKGVADQYRKLRNTFRYLLGALEGFTDAEAVPVAEMPELERYILHRLAEIDARLRQAVDDFDFNSYTRLLSDFANEDLSAFFFDIRKDVLYCEVNPATGTQTAKRRAYRTVLNILFEALVRYAAPVLVFTAEEVWGTRYPDAGSVHLLEWPEVDAGWRSSDFREKWQIRRSLRSSVSETIEPMRQNKQVGSSLEACVRAELSGIPSDIGGIDFAELFIVSEASVVYEVRLTEAPPALPDSANKPLIIKVSAMTGYASAVQAERTTHHKCGRCWRHLPEVSEDGALCGRCEAVLDA